MDEDSVFLNVPYDKKYEPLFATLIASIVSLGLTPRCVLEISETGEGRLLRIQELLASCRVSIHDLSRVGTPVRFNMPFELGLACGLARHDPPHDIVVLEKEPYRLDRTLSDYKGRNPLIHGNSCDRLVTCVLDVFVSPDRATPAAGVRRVAQLLRRLADVIKRQNHIDSVFHRSAFHELARAAMHLAVEEGLIER